MWRNILALLGLLTFITGAILMTVEASQQQPESVDSLAARVAFRDDIAVIIAGIGLLLGPILTIPWWQHRLRREQKWFEKRDEPVEGPPRVPN